MRSGVNIPCERPLCFPLVSSSSSSSYSSPWTALLVDVPEWLIFTASVAIWGESVNLLLSVGECNSNLHSDRTVIWSNTLEKGTSCKEETILSSGGKRSGDRSWTVSFRFWKCLEFVVLQLKNPRGGDWMITHPTNISGGWMDEKKPGETINKPIQRVWYLEGKRTFGLEILYLLAPLRRLYGISKILEQAIEIDHTWVQQAILSIIYWFIVYMNTINNNNNDG